MTMVLCGNDRVYFADKEIAKRFRKAVANHSDPADYKAICLRYKEDIIGWNLNTPHDEWFRAF